jgi:hypothetical protein
MSAFRKEGPAELTKRVSALRSAADQSMISIVISQSGLTATLLHLVFLAVVVHGAATQL